MDINSLVSELSLLAGFGALIAVVVNALKSVGAVKDGQAGTFSAGLNILLLAVLLAVRVYQPGLDLAGYDALAAQVAQIGVLALGLFVQLGGAKLAHSLLRGVPVIGKSFS